MKKIALLSTFLAGFTVSHTALALTQPELNQITQQIENRLSEEKITGISIAVVKDNTPLMLDGFGFANIQTQQPVTSDTQFRIASITKTFVTLAVLKLVDEGKLSLDDSVYKHLSDFRPKVLPNNSDKITVRDLLTHQSGIPSGWYRGDEPTTTPDQDLNSLAELLSDEYLVWDRGTISAYNNNAFALAGLLVSRVSGQSWQAYLQSEFFDPLGMDSTLSHLPNGPLPTKMAESYSGTQIEPKYAALTTPAGGMISTGNDMARYMQAILDSWNYNSHAILPASLIKTVRNVQNDHVKLDGDHQMGLGFFIESYNGHIAIKHDGSYQGYESSMYIVPELNFGVFVTTNNRVGASAVEDIAKAVTSMVAQQSPGPFEQTSTPQLDESSKTLEAGAYVGTSSVFIEQNPSGEFSVFSEGFGYKPLKKVAAQTYQVQGIDYDIKIKPTEAIEGVRFLYDGKDYAHVFSKLVTTQLTPELEQLLGYYQIQSDNPILGDLILEYAPELQALVLVSVKYGFTRTVKVVGDNLLQVQGYGRGIGTVFDFSQPGKLNGLGYQFKKVPAPINAK
ncbi:serine hydrolase domain-containing protein [Pseudoalteromonas sp. Of7M-16]|uniref:serine hydrolase domain-containing protein n=1 Tax=Pseudoalteromonas sp. Of7M-16 TaxID=2917756 RepID=UPI001EF47385|nr:serine hydrolase domain-containing protein [Pseudoalteromonas sp. Of7M-16]MCG7547391.1 beta-lactamase family protein [Pseudoalteromonas sp. Of7M-16]